MAVGFYDYEYEHWTISTGDGYETDLEVEEMHQGEPIAWMPLPKPYKESEDQMPISEILRKAVETYGIKHQTTKCLEEMGELMQAISKYYLPGVTIGDKSPLEHLQEEIADCCIMLEQMKIMYGEREITLKIMEKAKRLEKRLEK